MPKPRHIPGGLQVRTQVEDIDQHLDVPLGLHICAHELQCHHRLTVTHYERCR